MNGEDRLEHLFIGLIWCIVYFVVLYILSFFLSEKYFGTNFFAMSAFGFWIVFSISRVKFYRYLFSGFAIGVIIYHTTWDTLNCTYYPLWTYIVANLGMAYAIVCYSLFPDD